MCLQCGCTHRYHIRSIAGLDRYGTHATLLSSTPRPRRPLPSILHGHERIPPRSFAGLLPHRLEHDTSDDTSDHSAGMCMHLRPDFCLWVDDTLVFKVCWYLGRECALWTYLMEMLYLHAWVQGEVKARSHDMGVAVQKLGSKMGKLVFAVQVGGITSGWRS